MTGPWSQPLRVLTGHWRSAAEVGKQLGAESHREEIEATLESASSSAEVAAFLGLLSQSLAK